MNASGQLTLHHASETILPGGTAATRFWGQNTGSSTIWLNGGDAAGPGGGSFGLRPGEVFDSTFFPVDQDLNAWGEKGAEFTLKHD